MKSLQQYINESKTQKCSYPVKELIKELKKNPIEKNYKQETIMGYNVQSIPSGDAPTGGWGIVNSSKDKEDLSKIANSGLKNETLYLQIDRKPNTPWYDDNTKTYMIWK